MSPKSVIITLPESEKKVTLLYMPWINLYVISDAKGFGQHWVRIKYFRGIYDSNLVLGVDPDNVITSICRFLAESVIENKMAKNDDNAIIMDEINITFSISLRDHDVKTVRLIKEEFKKLL